MSSSNSAYERRVHDASGSSAESKQSVSAQRRSTLYEGERGTKVAPGAGTRYLDEAFRTAVKTTKSGSNQMIICDKEVSCNWGNGTTEGHWRDLKTGASGDFRCKSDGFKSGSYIWPGVQQGWWEMDKDDNIVSSKIHNLAPPEWDFVEGSSK